MAIPTEKAVHINRPHSEEGIPLARRFTLALDPLYLAVSDLATSGKLAETFTPRIRIYPDKA